MQPEAYRRLADRQHAYWWHRARRAMSAQLLRRYGLRRGFRWLDLGCGPGGNLGLLDAWQPSLTVGVDLSPLALELARNATAAARLVRADITKGLPFASGSFDLVTIFNVLYHEWVASEADVLAEMARVLKPGGLALITEPAFSVLAREMDRLVMGRRRYRLREFDDLCCSAGLEVVRASYFTSLPAAALLALKGAALATAPFRSSAARLSPDLMPLSPFVNEMLYRSAMVEARVIASGIRVPFGTTLVCLARNNAASAPPHR